MGTRRNERFVFGAVALAFALVATPIPGPVALAAPAQAGRPSTAILPVSAMPGMAKAVPLAKKPAPPRDPARINVLVNKKYPLVPKTYAPRLTAVPGTGIRLQPVASTAYKKLVAAARKDGVGIRLTSGYRSYAVQKSLLERYTRAYGSAYAQRIAAKPGTSEHQTGLAIDVGNPGGVCALQGCFANTKVGKWMALNAHKHGFILRYPRGMEKTTGYIHEPWHFRYVGIAQAKAMTSAKTKSLEHYYSVASGPKSAKLSPPKPLITKGTKKTTANLNMRRGPTTGSGIIKTVPKGSGVQLTGTKSGVWLKAKHGRSTGWMSSKYLR